jgi:hypothetical protein
MPHRFFNLIDRSRINLFFFGFFQTFSDYIKTLRNIIVLKINGCDEYDMEK